MTKAKKAYTKKTKRLGIPHMYNFFTAKNPDIEIDYRSYAQMIRMANDIFVDGMVEEGIDLNLGFALGRIGIRKQERYFDPSKTQPKSIDWKSTNELNAKRAPGEKKKLVFFTDPYYFRVYWEKALCKVKNKQVYHFKPTQGEYGFKAKLKEHLRKDQFADSLYKVKKIKPFDPSKIKNNGKKS